MKAIGFKIFHSDLRKATFYSICTQIIVQEFVVRGNVLALHGFYLTNHNVLCCPKPSSQPVQAMNKLLGSSRWPPPSSTNIVCQVIYNYGGPHDVDLSMRQQPNRVVYLIRHNNRNVQTVPVSTWYQEGARRIRCIVISVFKPDNRLTINKDETKNVK